MFYKKYFECAYDNSNHTNKLCPFVFFNIIFKVERNRRLCKSDSNLGKDIKVWTQVINPTNQEI